MLALALAGAALRGGWQPLTAWHGSGAASFTVLVKGAVFDFSV